MNGTFFRNPNFSEETDTNPKFQNNNFNILKENISKKVKVYTSTLSNTDIKTFSGILEKYIDNNIILSDPSSGNWFLIPINYLYYIEFEEKINL